MTEHPKKATAGGAAATGGGDRDADAADAAADVAGGRLPVSYAAAEAELEQILTALEGEGVDVDQLSGHVQRAKALITWCRARVASAEVTITELLADSELPRRDAAAADGWPADGLLPDVEG